MPSALTYPLPVLPSIPDDLENLDARHALPHLMALMKNTLIRGLNRVHACAPLVLIGHPAVLHFLDYVRSLLVQLDVHLEEDATFFSGSALAEIASSEANPDTQTIRERIISLTSLVSTWIKDESTYCSSALCEGLSFGPLLVSLMHAQIGVLTPTLLSSIISHSDLLELITGSVGRISERSDMTFLLPFVLSHHDRTTSTHWPRIPEGCSEMLTTLILNHPGCWQFAPFNPLTHETQNLIAISA
ncbi:hypothetical protein DEU56DRAFT_775420 [Suillus clintonianus]|uniref:uncharacterized protein n=1 Tax=Suillus clintonianus TaxID=1904413 RepID=UPI001B878BA9|nr:uncharacterized protein DEU56DRAFT_775420 [Suillus clintonianus]KAG2153420.1 hypothetical protein DEU56DRAFT_775420 [Suillus clintonianus]